MKRIVVTGGLGFVGTNLIPRLKSQMTCDIIVFDNESNPSGDLPPLQGLQRVVGDMRDREQLDRVLEKVDAVVHLAADTRVMDSIEHPVFNFEVNVVGTLNLLESMRRRGVKTLVNASTGGAILGEVTPPVHEEMAACPASPYGASKLAVEGYCAAYAQAYGIQAVSLRFSNIYGKFSRNKKSVVAAFMKDIHRNQKVTVYGDGSQTRDYLYADDLADGIIQAMTAGSAGGAFQLGSGKPTSLNELIGIFKAVLPVEFEVEYRNFRDGEIRHTYCDISKARRSFGFNPSKPLAEGIRETWDWYRSTMI